MAKRVKLKAPRTRAVDPDRVARLLGAAEVIPVKSPLDAMVLYMKRRHPAMTLLGFRAPGGEFVRGSSNGQDGGL